MPRFSWSWTNQLRQRFVRMKDRDATGAIAVGIHFCCRDTLIEQFKCLFKHEI